MQELGDYKPEEFEADLYESWLDEDLFEADSESDKPSFSMVIPPPNVTGTLHIGHALNSTLQDVLCRWKRMQGYEVLWVPGTDHAGIATQNKVEQKLEDEGTSRHDLGREDFVDEVWDWKEDYGGRIIEQLKGLGVSCDWSRERFTMDDGLSSAVEDVFVNLYEDGYIYRGDYIVNWCPRCQTALSDIEVEYEEQDGHWYHLQYLLIDRDDSLHIATTRPETMLGDTAVAYHPDDERYQGLEGERVRLPLVDREIPVVADNRVDPDFGSGLVKITPGHDDLDFRIGEDHGLEIINLLNPDGTFNENAGERYQGLDRNQVRDKVVQDLRDEDWLTEVEDYRHEVGQCYRCDTVIEPYVSDQWFVAMEDLAEPAIDKVRNDDIEFHPERWEKTYFEWMENIRDWCISRQIWWGHRIPVWYGPDDEYFVARDEEEAREKARDHYGEDVELQRDPDVLDTWFSSALWPFSTLGWPDETQDLDKFYPTDVLSTGFDIIYFWVARMIMMGLYCMDEIPFSDVYIHALIRDEDGRKMSKSLGNVIDPLDVIDDHGCDPLRFTLCALAAQGRDIKLSTDRIEGFRNFANKYWNAAKYVQFSLEDTDVGELDESIDFEKTTPVDRWILSRFSTVIEEATGHLENYDFDRYADALYQFLWHEYCDWYIEMSKLQLRDDESPGDVRETQKILLTVLEEVTKALHPVMPFITERVFQAFHTEQEHLVNADWPEPPEQWEDSTAVKQLNRVRDVIRAGRHLKKEFHVQTSEDVRLLVDLESEADQYLNDYVEYIADLAGIESIRIETDLERPEMATTEVLDFADVYLPLKGLIDVEQERQRLQDDIEDRQERKGELEGRLNNPEFRENAPQDVIDESENELEQVEDEIERLQETLEELQEDAKAK
ncbi:MAG: valine--tRNA ligase [bacterium]